MKFFGKEQPESQYSPLQEALIKELLRQTRLTFNLALAVSAISSAITLSGVGLLYFNKITPATLTTGVGLLATFNSAKLAKQTKADLKETTSCLENEV